MESQHPTEKLLSKPRSIEVSEVTGCLTPFKDGQPWFIRMPNNPSFWVAVFSTKDKLEASCAELGITDYTIKQVTDGRDFIKSIVEGGVRIMRDPYAVRSENKTRWTEIILE
jgi:hypothetical protein